MAVPILLARTVCNGSDDEGDCLVNNASVKGGMSLYAASIAAMLAGIGLQQRSVNANISVERRLLAAQRKRGIGFSLIAVGTLLVSLLPAGYDIKGILVGVSYGTYTALLGAGMALSGGRMKREYRRQFVRISPEISYADSHFRLGAKVWF